jgi:nicotinate dehydrogenase subunit B
MTIPTRDDLLARTGVLLITRPPVIVQGLVPVADMANRPGDLDIFIAVTAEGTVFGFNGHVDLGTGIRTALTQIIAEELDIAPERVRVVLGDTEQTPDQGPTIASETIQISAEPLRLAAAQARQILLEAASTHLGVAIDQLHVKDGTVSTGAASVSYADLLQNRTIRAELSDTAVVKDPAQYRLVGTPMHRVDIPSKAVGSFSYVHDIRVPGMLHGRVVRPPYLGYDSGPFVGRSLVAVDEASIAHLPGIIAIVTQGDFVGIVANREEQADAAMRTLRVTWKAQTPGLDLSDVDTALRAQPATRRLLLEKGDVDAALKGAEHRLSRSYSWPYQMHGSIGPSCAVADHTPGRLMVWSGTQNPHLLRGDLARLMGMAVHEIEVTRVEAAGCYGRNCADDVTGDAALLSRAVGRPVRVQLTREQEHAWEPKGAAQICDVSGGINAAGHPVGYDFVTRYPSNLAPMLPLLLTGIVPPVADVAQMGDRTAVPPYDYPTMRIACDDMAPLVRASWFRGVSALPNSFAHECFIDELATQAGVDPVEYRLRYLKDERAADLVRAVAARVGWKPRTGPRMQAEGDILRGQGFAYAVYVHSKFPGYGAAWAAWAAEVEVNRRTGEVVVSRVTVGQDAGLMINPDGVRHQVHGNVVQSVSRTLKERVTFDDNALVSSQEWGGYPIMTFREVPDIDVMLMERPDQPPLGVGESASVPSAAAIANAIFDATGIRFRNVPFTADVVLAGLTAAAPPPRRRGWRAAMLGLGTAAMVAGAGLFGLHRAIPAEAPLGPDVFSASLIEHGRLLAAAGNCAACHTAAEGLPYAGGHAVQTPFGAIYAPNITPDRETGIGTFSFAAFQRAMREGIGRDGQNLYPAFPYTSFAKMTDGDLLALYAFLMAQTPVSAKAPETRLRFPFNLRPLLAGWNLLFNRAPPIDMDPAQSAQWNRGNYLVNAVAHCGACHTPRNGLGAERASAYLDGALIDGWEAPPLSALSKAPIPWTESALYDYLRHGAASEHGTAAGPMGPVVASLHELPDSDIAAIAHYVASLTPNTAQPIAAEAFVAASWTGIGADATEGARLFAGACQSCHHDGHGPPVFGTNIPLALNTNLHSDRPDNLLRMILEGIAEPAKPGLGPMPGFRDSMNDHQVAELARFLRQRFAPDQPAWQGLEKATSNARNLATAAR